VIVFQGDNAQGKTNLLEAIYLLATTKSARARSDAELISWDAAAAANPLMPTTFAARGGPPYAARAGWPRWRS